LMKVFNSGRKRKATYSLRQAMKDASKSYH
jgi:hypothetical protein